MTPIRVYVPRGIFVPIAEAGASAKVPKYWPEVPRVPVTSFPKDGREVLSMKGGYA